MYSYVIGRCRMNVSLVGCRQDTGNPPISLKLRGWLTESWGPWESECVSSSTDPASCLSDALYIHLQMFYKRITHGQCPCLMYFEPNFTLLECIYFLGLKFAYFKIHTRNKLLTTIYSHLVSDVRKPNC